MNSLKDKVIFVADADTNVGEAVAELFSQNGCHVILSGSSARRLQAIARKNQNASTRVVVVNTDISDRDALQQSVDSAVRSLGGVNFMVFCSPRLPWRTTKSTSSNELKEVWHRQVTAPLTLLHIASPNLKATQGSVLFMSSFGARKPDGVLSVASAAREHAARLVAKELRPYDVKLNTVSCYSCEASTSTLNWLYWFLHGAPLRRRNATASDIARYVAFVVSGSVGHVTGNSLYVDGGLTMTCPVSYSMAVRIVSLSSYYTKIWADYITSLFAPRPAAGVYLVAFAIAILSINLLLF